MDCGGKYCGQQWCTCGEPHTPKEKGKISLFWIKKFGFDKISDKKETK